MKVMNRLFHCILIIAVSQRPYNVEGHINSLVEVYDNVLVQDTSRWLHDQCESWSNPDMEEEYTFVSVFPLAEPERHTALEQFLNGILTEIYPNVTEPTYHVEFWSRSDWLHVPAHQDMDEAWERQTESRPSTPLRYPETGHVLYLQMGRKTQGPTLVWNASRGGDMIYGPSSYASQMIAVPAVEGRLLRFQGHLLHAVPRPADVFWTRAFDQEGSNDSWEYQRSVLLFNTWRIHDTLVDALPLNATKSKEEAAPISKSCNPRKDWKEVQVVDHQVPEQSWLSTIFLGAYESIEVPLMGVSRRRGMKDESAMLDAPLGARKAMKESSQVTRMEIRPSKLRLFGYEF